MARVAHLSSVHYPNDTRIFHKECRSLAGAGFEVFLVVSAERDAEIDGVKIRSVRRAESRFERLFKTVPEVLRIARELKADVYHIHDPELIPIGLVLRRGGAKVIYDIHEDYITSILQKDYIPRVVRVPLAHLVGAIESVTSRLFVTVLAERYYAGRFPGGTIVCNYPLLGSEVPSGGPPAIESEGIHLLYTGTVADDRGAYEHAALADVMPDAHVHFIGRCDDPGLADEIRRRAGRGVDRINLVGEGTHVPFSRILAAYAERRWTAGLAIFPATPHYVRKELTKFFEYMAAGIPIVCSDFPVWRALVADNGFGLCVDPSDRDAAVAAVRYLAENPQEAREMGLRGQRAVRERFNWEAEVRKLEALYRTLVGTDRMAA